MIFAYFISRDIVLKAIDLWIHRSIKFTLPYDPDQLEEDDGDEETNNDEDVMPCQNKGLPHDETLCEMCDRQRKNCTIRTRSG